jgi:tetratricopeptide (TPR) repeat protein
MFSRKSLLLLTLAVVMAGAAGYWVLINPDNPFTQLFQRKISDANARIVVGPYPGEGDFRLLKANNVRTIVSLLDANIPYEGTLLAREKGLAAQYGMTFLNFPMSSILGQKFGDYYQDSASRAAAAIAGTSDKVYLHCYLGLHRIQAVRDLLAAKGVQAATYTVREAERAASSRQLDGAQAAYDAGRYQDALNLLAKIDLLSPDARLLQAWSHYRLSEISDARQLFQAFLDAEPGNRFARLGLGFCALRDGDLTTAERRFAEVLAGSPKDAEALGGMGLTYYRAGRLDDAIRYLDGSLQIVPDNQELREVLARARVQQTAVGRR